MSEITLFNRWKVKKLYFWLGVGAVPFLCVVFILLNLFSVSVGNVYSSMEGDLAGYGGGFDANESFYAEWDAAADGEYAYEEAYDEKGYNEAESVTVSSTGAVPAERLIIREGTISIYAEKTRQTRDDIEALVANYASEGGYVINASESSRGEGKEPYITMAIRVPVDQFSYVMDAIADMGVEVINSYEDAQDVTEEYVDLEGRIEALEASRDRLLELMADAEFTEDLLRAEQELTIREAELESFYGRLNYLSESARLSRIYIDLQPYELYEPIDTSWKPAETVRRAVEDLLESMQGFAEFMIVFGIAVLPWLIFFGLIIWGVVALVRWRRSKKQTES
jgi:hypothetical protein